VIAQPLLFDEEFPQPRVGSRAGRAAVGRRRSLRRRSRYLLLGRIVASLAIGTVAIGIYLALMANVTRMNYELSKNLRTQTRLSDESARLDDEIQGLSSRERLGFIGAKLGMHEAESFAQISLPREYSAQPAAGIAFLPWLK
jgi:hypothetical protein